MITSVIIRLFSDQFPGEAIKVRVIDEHEGLYAIEAVADAMRLQSLVSNRSIVVLIERDGCSVTYDATFKRMSGGHATIKYEAHDVLTRRHFERLQTGAHLRLAAVPTNPVDESRLQNLRWIQTETRDISAGGLLFASESEMITNNLILLNLSAADVPFPTLLAGEVRHSRVAHDEHLIGVRFITNEEIDKKASLAKLRQTLGTRNRFGKHEQVLLNTDIVAKKYDEHRNGVKV